MSRIARRTGHLAFAAALAISLATAARAGAAGGEPFPEPPALAPAVAFWVRVYTEATTDGGFLHDARLLDVVYEHIRFEGEASPRARERIVERHKSEWREVLEWLARGGEPRSERETQIVRLFSAALGRPPQSRDFRDAKDELRFQLGQRDKFRDGLVRSGAYEAEMREVFREQGMPDDLALLPHVESSFNVRAYSKYGAAGVWQFMRGTGRRFMKVDYVVDERLDPITSTRAAARLLRENHALLGTWPLALTAYNHGAGGMARAVKRLGTDHIDEIVLRYDGRTFGFASRNFYAQFLAARKVLRSYESYFGPVHRDSPRDVDVVTLPFYADAADLQQRLGVSVSQLTELNPALRPPVFRSGKRIPRGYALRLPAGSVSGDASTWLASVPSEMRHPEQRESRYYTVRRGDTVSLIASRNRTNVSALLAQNDLGPHQHIYPGQVLQVPDHSGGGKRAAPAAEVVRTAQASPAQPAPAATPAVTSAVTPPEPAAVTPASSVSASAPAQPAGTAPVAETQATAPPPTVPPAPAPEIAAEAAPRADAVKDDVTGEVATDDDTDEAAAEVDPEPLQMPDNIAQASAPVVVASADPAPAAAPAAEPVPPGVPDDSPYRRVDRERVLVDDDETLGHFADWLEVSPQRVRNLNHLKPRQPIHVGQTLKLDFSKVSPEEFMERRLEYHKGIEEDFFGSYRVTGTVEHSLRPGDTLWVLSRKLYGVPTWLIHRYNPDVDFARLTPGTKLAIPVIEKLG
ncbi:MAG: LysM peptidoglycan-binding domain-containing protein [Myxococcota bacterium]